jgi:hypothetical protein
LFGVRIARVGLGERASSRSADLVSDLYSDAELPFRESFKVTTDEANRRWSSGEQELCRLTVLEGVSALDALLGGSIDLLRALGKDTTGPGAIDTGVSAKLTHVGRHGGMAIADGTIRLYDLCLSIRNALTHDGRRQKKVISAWRRLPDPEQGWWSQAAGRSMPLSGPADELVLDDRELVAAFKTFDRIAGEVSKQLREEVEGGEWARIVAHEYWRWNPTRAGDSTRNVETVRGWARQHWRLSLTAEEAEAGLSYPNVRRDPALARLLRPPLA